jgi:GntR family transcriptional repressor for pyruvate dehydrogenase complex
MKRVHSFTSLKQKPLAEQVAEELEAKILGGEYKPKDTLPAQGELARMFSVSLTVIREAMGKLSTAGLIEIAQGKLPRVADVGTGAAVRVLGTLLQRGGGSVRELREVRSVIEGAIAFIAAQRRHAPGLALLEEAGLLFSRAETVEEFVEADITFHRALATCTGNTYFILLIDTLAELLKESQTLGYKNIGTNRARTIHNEIAEAVKSGNPENAREAMEHHLDLTEQEKQ